MIAILDILVFIIGVLIICVSSISYNYDDAICLLGLFFIIISFIIFIYGMFFGFIYHKPTEGIHQGIITAIDLEGVYFRRYEIYLKSNGYTQNGDETKYLLYDYENELADQIKGAIGKEVILKYGHDGGYIPWNSCGTYHIKSIEIMEDKNEEKK